MSRSYKHTLYCYDFSLGFFKKYANRRFRHLPISDEEVATAKKKYYVRTFPSYEIVDYSEFGMPFDKWLKHREEVAKLHNIPLRKATQKELYREWYTTYKMK